MNRKGRDYIRSVCNKTNLTGLIWRMQAFAMLSFIGIFGGWAFNVIYLIHNFFFSNMSWWVALVIFGAVWLIMILAIRLIVRPIGTIINAQIRAIL